MTRRQLFKEVNVKCLELHRKYNINYGGCCYVAAILAELLTKCNIPYQVVFFNNHGDHYAIKVSDRYLNRSGFNKYDIDEIYYCSYQELYNVYYSDDWNSCYNTKYNGIVKESLVEIFSKYGKRRNHRQT